MPSLWRRNRNSHPCWNFRNSVVFDNSRGSVSELVERLKVTSWQGRFWACAGSATDRGFKKSGASKKIMVVCRGCSSKQEAQKVNVQIRI
jgi:hypothetical protein